MAAVQQQAGGNIDAGMHICCQIWTYNAVNQNGLIGCNYYITTKTGFGDITFGDVAEDFCNWIKASTVAVLSTDATFSGVKCFQLTQPPTPLGGIATDPASGGDAGGILPGQVCGITSYRTLLTGRAYRGRHYLPFPSQANVDTDGTPSTTYLTDANIWQGKYRTYGPLTVGAVTATFVPIVFHKASGTHTVIGDGFAKKKWATQRRRGDFGRLNNPVIS